MKLKRINIRFHNNTDKWKCKLLETVMEYCLSSLYHQFHWNEELQKRIYLGGVSDKETKAENTTITLQYIIDSS